MSLSTAIIDAMLSAGCTAEQLAAAVKASNADEDARRAAKRAGNAERQRRWRERNASNALSSVTERDTPYSPVFPDKENSPEPPKEINPTTPLPPKNASAGFDTFWELYPNKVGKAEASKAFVRAQGRVSFDALISGLRRYLAKTDDRPWCNPATWLNQGRWDDEPATAQPRAGPVRRNELADAFGAMDQEIRRNEYDHPPSTQGVVLSLPAASGRR